jgi:hypothetical protein
MSRSPAPTRWSTALEIGFRDLPISRTIVSANFTLAAADRGQAIIYDDTGDICTVPLNASVAIGVGAFITIVNNGTGTAGDRARGWRDEIRWRGCEPHPGCRRRRMVLEDRDQHLALRRDGAHLMLPMLLSSVSAIALSLSTTSASGISGSSTCTSNTVTATASSGVPPYTYSWAVTSAFSIVALNPTSPSTAFQVTGLARGASATGTAVLTVTDSAAQTKQSPPVNIELERSTIGGGGTL